MAPAAARMDFLSPRLMPKDLVVVEAEAATEVDTEKVVSVAVAETVTDAVDEVNVADDGLVVSAKHGNVADARTCISMNLSNASIAGQVLAP